MAIDTNERARAVRASGVVFGALAILVAAGAAWWLVFRNPRPETPIARQPVRYPMLTELDSFEVADALTLVGREVSLRAVPASRVIGDWTFYIGRDAKHEIPVVIADEKSGKVEESEVRVRKGVLLDIEGSVRRNDDPKNLGNPHYIDRRELAELQTKSIYIDATRVVRHSAQRLAE